MSNEEKINLYRQMSRDELEQILDNEEQLSEEDIIIASIELGEKDKKAGNYFTTEQVLENVFGRNYMASEG